jgi:hypothetical protein
MILRHPPSKLLLRQTLLIEARETSAFRPGWDPAGPRGGVCTPPRHFPTRLFTAGMIASLSLVTGGCTASQNTPPNVQSRENQETLTSDTAPVPEENSLSQTPSGTPPRSREVQPINPSNPEELEGPVLILTQSDRPRNRALAGPIQIPISLFRLGFQTGFLVERLQSPHLSEEMRTRVLNHFRDHLGLNFQTTANHGLRLMLPDEDTHSSLLPELSPDTRLTRRLPRTLNSDPLSLDLNQIIDADRSFLTGMLFSRLLEMALERGDLTLTQIRNFSPETILHLSASILTDCAVGGRARLKALTVQRSQS